MSIARLIFALGLLFILTPFGSPAIALALGLVIALTIGNPFPDLSGKPAKYLLQASVIMLGFGINLGAVYEAGRDGIVFIIAVVFGALALGFVIGKILKVSPKVSALVSCGTAICGGSAIAVVGPAIKAENDEMSVSLGTIFVLNAIALFVYPFIGQFFGLSQGQFGLWAAISIQDTSSVVGAATAYGPESLTVATTVKLARALWIAPLALALAFAYREAGAKTKIAVPWFIFLFVGAAAVRTYAPAFVQPSIFESLVNLAKAGLTVTLFLIGLSLSRAMLKRVGWRPFAQGASLWILLSVLSLWAVLRYV
jgi:uncharacterized integral membrane protein (TIGR00698 family)